MAQRPKTAEDYGRIWIKSVGTDAHALLKQQQEQHRHDARHASRMRAKAEAAARRPPLPAHQKPKPLPLDGKAPNMLFASFQQARVNAEKRQATIQRVAQLCG